MSKQEDADGREALQIVVNMQNRSRATALRLGLPRDFIENLQSYDDWAFCVLAATLVESALNETLSHGFHFSLSDRSDFELDLSMWLERLPLTNKRKLAKACGCGENWLDFVECLALVRNTYAHEVRNVNKGLAEIVLTHAERQKLLRAFNPDKNDKDHGEFISFIQEDRGAMKFVLLHQVLGFVTLMNLKADKNQPAKSKQG